MQQVLRELAAIREGIVKINAEQQRSQQLIAKIDELTKDVEDELFDVTVTELILPIHNSA